MSNVISNPSHYTKGREYEPRKVIEDWDLDFYLGNALKYISRCGRKYNAIEDLQKAKQYIDFEIEKLEKDEPKAYAIGVNNESPVSLDIGVVRKIVRIDKDQDMNNCEDSEMKTPKYAFEFALKDIDNAIKRCKALPDSREKSVSITKLEEAQMWVRRAMNND